MEVNKNGAQGPVFYARDFCRGSRPSGQAEAAYGLAQARRQLTQLQTGAGGVIRSDGHLVGGLVDPLHIAAELIGNSVLLSAGTGDLDPLDDCPNRPAIMDKREARLCNGPLVSPNHSPPRPHG